MPTDLEQAHEAQTRGLGFVTLCSIENERFTKMQSHLRGFTDEYFNRDPNRHWTSRGRTLYVLEPADPKLKWSTLRVYDAYEMAHNPDKGASGENDPEPLKEQYWKSAGDIAQELVKVWGEVVPGQLGARGVGLISGDMPTNVELKSLADKQALYHDRLIMEADAFVSEGLNRNVAEKHQRAARARGVVRAWQIQSGDMKTCPNCGEAVYATALGCKSCGTIFMDWYEAQYYSIPQVRIMDPRVADAMDIRARNKAAQAAGQQIPKPPIPPKAA